MPVYPGRRKGIWRVTAYVSGRQREKSVHGTEQDALDEEARLRLELRASPIRATIDPVTSVWCATVYSPHARATLGANTWKLSRAYIVSYLMEFFGPMRLSEIGPTQVSQYTALRLQTLARSTLNLELGTLSQMLKFAAEHGHPVQRFSIKRLRTDERRVHFWTAAEQAKLLRVCAKEDPELLPMLRFMLRTGVRKGEAIAAVRAWLVKRGGRPVLGITPYEGWTTKSRRVRDVPLSAAFWTELQRGAGERYLFPNAHGKPHRWFPQWRFMDVVKAAGLRGGPHTTRHSFASAYLDAGGTLHDLAGLLGHSLTRVTEMYAHLLPSHLERARSVLATLDVAGRARRRA